MIQEARYTSPSGRETVFAWETAKRDTELKTGVYTFPGRDGASVQHQGAGARTFPLACIFSGDNYTARADEFEDMLIERGVAELQHPIYGTIKVKPVGHIAREDDPVNKLGESTVTVTFTETLAGEDAAELNEVAADAIEEKYDEFSEAAAADFATAIEAANITEQMDITTSLETQTQSIIDNLKPIAAGDKKSFADWLASVKELKDNIKNLYSKAKGAAAKVENVYIKALNIARLTLRIMKLPSNIAVSLSEKIKGYSTLTANLINQYKNDPFGIEKIKAAYAAAALALTGAAAAIASGSALTVAEVAALTGAVQSSPARSSISAGTVSREDAIEAANRIAKFFETVIAFQDTKIAQNVFIDASPSAHIAFNELIYNSIQLILNASFALPMQKTITLDRDRQVIELCAELYGTTDYLDEFIIENNFTINEIELLPMGKKVSYYVKNA
ncbi:MAG: DNA circularization N-terminal domain-containing protein [Spirochaetaceae bacterium]|jgi:prophage DNA circulation protein|nr:DNA circularization N-terminal domain-containing protein [Spirochaetaceae bacterium]